MLLKNKHKKYRQTDRQTYRHTRVETLFLAVSVVVVIITFIAIYL